ncbi:MAG: hypothetical protein JSV34_01835 [Candidatus Omnitrophota bacterium]|nr:MAG: hypothetical protein JSV34_01835 [Candidatus Omnitrophota bacterium]
MRVSKGIAIFILLFCCFLAKGLCLWPQPKYPFTDEDRDPFSPLISRGGRILIPQEETVSNFVLRGIIYSEDKALAIINDEILKENDRIGEYIILRVEEKRVILKNEDEEIILKLEEE